MKKGWRNDWKRFRRLVGMGHIWLLIGEPEVQFAGKRIDFASTLQKWEYARKSRG